MRSRLLRVFLLGSFSFVYTVQTPASAPADPTTTSLPYEDVEVVWNEIRPYAPEALAGASRTELEAIWPRWLRSHDTAIRDRVAQGELDSLVNLWLFGTSFTDLPVVRPRDVATRGGGATLAEIADRRLSDLVKVLARPEVDDRLRWAVRFLTQRRGQPGTPDGDARIRELLRGARQRMLAENAEYTRTLVAPNTDPDLFSRMRQYASLYRDRGLSTDTSILSSYAIDRALEVLKNSGKLGPIRRVAVVGPGLDFVNKADGHDFYPEQTIQPFALIDSLVRLGLSRLDDLSVTTFDISARVNEHLEAARRRARAGGGYIIELPLSDVEHWNQGMVTYWQHMGTRLGEEVSASKVPPSAGTVRVRAVKVRPDIVLAISPTDLNVVVERLTLPADDRFDLVVATNVFIYYDTFAQALAALNIGQSLRPGGSLLSNQAILPLAPLKSAVGQDAVVYSERQFDPVFWYQRE